MLLDVSETLFFSSTHKGWKPQIFFKVSYGRDAKELLNATLHILMSVGTKEDIGLILVNFLTTTFFVNSQNV